MTAHSTERAASAGARSPRGPYSTTPARRAQIVRAAIASFATHGYERASLRDIAARAQVTHAALLRHFASKDDLLLAALAQRDADDEELAGRILQASVAPEEVLPSVLEAEFAHPEHQRNWLAITVAATDPSHPAHDFFVARRERMRQHFGAGRLSIGDHDAEISADEKVTMVMAMVDGLRIQALMDPSREMLPLLKTFMATIVSRGGDRADGGAAAAPHG
ncbi:TetR/AcrR family transcriptional regulator [Microbacterium stercoris]|uniref:TetR/AcrR family transcriptional regulator n=1 Tax=Microbacterium stercoris TaxID=2820289 RepID=A0A939TPS0_9MICO|nr:TetR/AcrR family transcriptional regulator [Microbacterium stercoris]MBO3662700.1 TetR/AcrR family transcriptional regulator [Microbacterium stercoris]